MQNSYFTTTNTKGQIVIPKKIRELLDLKTDTLLKISNIDTRVIIEKAKDFDKYPTTNKAYLDLLLATQGSWIDDQTIDKSHELIASKNRKKAW